MTPDLDDPLEQLFSQGVTDGLPVVVPTRERVARAIAATGRDAEELIASVPPAYGRATVEKIAVNAVMAGCRPEYLPVVIAGVEAICDDAFDLHGVSGTTEDRAPLGIAFNFGTPLVNGVAITAGGLAFTGALDAYLRAFDAKSGQELWQGRLPVPGVANPMTYLWKGEQYVAIGAGGHSESGTTIGDSVVAFRLARPGEAPSLRSRTIDRPGGRFMSGAIVVGFVVVLMAALLWRWRRGRVGRA